MYSLSIKVWRFQGHNTSYFCDAKPWKTAPNLPTLHPKRKVMTFIPKRWGNGPTIHSSCGLARNSGSRDCARPLSRLHDQVGMGAFAEPIHLAWWFILGEANTFLPRLSPVETRHSLPAVFGGPWESAEKSRSFGGKPARRKSQIELNLRRQ